MSEICDVTWNRKSVSVICRVTWFIIRPTIWNEFDIVCIKLWVFRGFLQILHAISKVQLCCSIFSIKTFSKLVPSFGEVVWPFGNFFVSFLCLRLFKFLPFVRETFLILWNVKRMVFFATAFHCCFLISHSVFCSVSHRRSFYLRYSLEQSHCLPLKVLHVSGFFLPLLLLKYFLSRGNWSLTELIFQS